MFIPVSGYTWSMKQGMKISTNNAIVSEVMKNKKTVAKLLPKVRKKSYLPSFYKRKLQG
jgi:hypothetical protein